MNIEAMRKEKDHNKRLATENGILAKGDVEEMVIYAFEVLDGRWFAAEDSIYKSNQHWQRYIDRFNLVDFNRLRIQATAEEIADDAEVEND